MRARASNAGLRYRSHMKIHNPASYLALALLVISSCAAASEGPVSKSLLGVAIGGMDTVAYHEPGAIAAHRASEGEKAWVTEWRGATWRFSSAENLAAFEADPDRYRPAYGGHCANALALGEGLIKTDGSHWEILGDRLYLFYAARGRDRWIGGDWEAYRAEADRAWLEITGKAD